MIEKCHHYYISWKYWHAVKGYVDALSVVVAYDSYKEYVTETLALEAFEVEKDEIQVMCFHTFKVKVSRQGLAYKVNKLQYPDDKFMRRATHLCKKRTH